MACTLYQSVEIVGINADLVALGCHVKCLTYVFRYHTADVTVARKAVLFRRKHQQVREIQASCFQHTHYL